MPKAHVDLWIYTKGQKKILYLQKKLEIDFSPTIGMCFEPELWTNSDMRDSILSCNKNKFLKFRVVDLSWSEVCVSNNVYISSLSVDVEGTITTKAFDFIWKNLDEIELKTDWGYTGFPVNPVKYFNHLRKEQKN